MPDITDEPLDSPPIPASSETTDEDPNKDSSDSPPIDASPEAPPVDNPETPTNEPFVRLANSQVAQEVRDGKWGVKKARRERLIAAGYDYKAVMRELHK